LKEARGENRLVVRAEAARGAEALDDIEQGAEERNSRARAQLAKEEAGARAVIEQAEHGARAGSARQEREV
jgi:hypothetical protein